MTEIEAKDLKEKMESGAVILIDVREAWEFEEGSISERNISLYELPSRIEELRAEECEMLVFCCNSGQNSLMAATLAEESGLSNVAHLKGGIDAWKESFPS